MTALKRSDPLGKQRQREAALAQRMAVRLDQEQTEAGIVENVELRRANGEEIIGSPRGRREVLSDDGLLWLIRKGELTDQARLAAERYREDYNAAGRDSIRSCLNVVEGSTGFGPRDISQTRFGALIRLDAACVDGLKRHPDLIDLVDRVVGRGETIRSIAGGDKHKAERAKVMFLCALDLLALYYGYLTPATIATR